MRLDLVEHTRHLLAELSGKDDDNISFFTECLEISPRSFISRNKRVPYYKIHSRSQITRRSLVRICGKRF